LLGLRPSTTGIYGLAPGIRKVRALDDRVTLPRHFADQSYSTFTAGKIFHDGSLSPVERVKEFQEWGSTAGMPYPPEKFVHTPDDIPAMDWGVYPADDHDQADWKIADSAIARLKDAAADQPFFIAAGFRLPHVPCFASWKWFELYPEASLVMPEVHTDDRNDVPVFSWFLHWKLPEPRLSWLKINHQWRPLVQAYLASVSFMDSQVGRVLDALEATDRAGDTIVVFWSDHGWHLGEKGITGKNSLWERSTHVPLIIAGPGVKAGGRCSQPVELLDLYPTLVELCHLPERAGLDGHSLVPQLKDAHATRPWPAITTHNRGNHSIRSEHWRYIRYADGTEELYDHRSDPNEWKNLANHSRFAEIKREHARWLPAGESAPVPGSATRFLDQEDGIWYWEGQPVVPGEGDVKPVAPAKDPQPKSPAAS
jgi:arylsulfatase A-like enzyme